MPITNAALAQQIADLVAYWRTRDTEYAAWVAGTATGGPYSNGTYPLTDYLLNVQYVKSPAALQASVDGIVSSASSYATAAQGYATAATTAQTAAEAARDLALSYRDSAIAARDLALSYKNYAASHETNAQSYATAAATSAAAAAADAASINGDVAAADASAVAAAASASAAAASAAAAATFDPALYLLKAGGTMTGTLTLGSDLYQQNGQPNYWMHETDVAADNKIWRFVASGGQFYAQIYNDAISAGTTWLNVQRSGITVSLVDIAATSLTFNGTAVSVAGHTHPYLPLAGGSITGTINWSGAAGGFRSDYPSLGRTYSNAATVLANNAYVNPADAVSGQVRTSQTHGSYGHTLYELYGGNHYWYGNNNSVTADAVVTKRTLMTLSVAGSCQVLDEFRTIGSSVVQNGTGFYVNSSAPRLITDTNGSYGTISLGGSKNTYSGIRFDASYWTTNLMFATNNTLWGFYSEASGTWDLLYNTGTLTYAAQKKIVAHGDTTTASDWGTSARMTRGTATPSGGTNGDIYFQYT